MTFVQNRYHVTAYNSRVDKVLDTWLSSTRLGIYHILKLFYWPWIQLLNINIKVRPRRVLSIGKIRFLATRGVWISRQHKTHVLSENVFPLRHVISVAPNLRIHWENREKEIEIKSEVMKNRIYYKRIQIKDIQIRHQIVLQKDDNCLRVNARKNWFQ